MPTVLITGASRGIGRAAALEFAARGYRVIATARDTKSLRGLDVAERLRMDVLDQQSVDEAVRAAGPVDVLLSNAGALLVGALEATPESEFERLFAQNTVGAIRVTKAVLPQMRDRMAGRLLFMSSVLGRTAMSGNAAYASSKWALEAAVETLAIEVQPFGIHTTLLEPSAVSTGVADDVLTYRLTNRDPYTSLATDAFDGTGAISPEAAARQIADCAGQVNPPLRVAVGDGAAAVLAERRSAPDDVPFIMGS
jgi:NADP-dependent 3-hydroxy acid dehydrogenase YdfG